MLHAHLWRARASLLRRELARARRALDAAALQLGTALHPWQVALLAELDKARADIAAHTGKRSLSSTRGPPSTISAALA